MKKAFTLVEVNLAIFIMSVGVLSMCGLYALGYRENRQSVEDVASVSLADTYLAPLVQALSAMDMEWSQWKSIDIEPNAGWEAYVQEEDGGKSYRVINNCNGIADSVFSTVAGKTPVGVSKPNLGDFKYGLVVTRNGSVIQLAFRVARRSQGLMSQPVSVIEVRYQGDPNENSSSGGAK